MRAVTYSRFSTDLQDRRSIADQQRELHRHAQSRGHHVVEDYADEAISGFSIANRPSLRRLIADAEARRFDLVLTENLDRLSRGQGDTAALYERLQFLGVQIETLVDGPITEMHVGLKGTMNALFLKDLAQKTRRGQVGRVKAGRIPGGRCYGYDVVSGDDRGRRAINGREAAVILRIFTEYADGRSPLTIVADLNRAGIPSPRGRKWNASTLNGSRKRANGILSNKLYIGLISYNRQHFVKDPATGRRQARPNPRSEWQEQTVPELRVVPQDLWDRAQARRREVAHEPFARRARPKHLLSGLLRCALCGGNYILVGSKYLGCSSYRNKRTCDNSRTISMDEVVQRVLAALERHLLTPEAVAAGVEAYRQERLRMARDRAKNEGGLRRELGELDRTINRWVDAIGDGTVDPKVIGPKLNLAQARKEEVEAQLRTAARDDAAVLHPRAAERYRKQVAQLRAAIKAGGETAGREVVALVRGMIEAIEVAPGPERMELTVVGDLASFLSREHHGNTISTPVVAGVGFEPTTFRL